MSALYKIILSYTKNNYEFDTKEVDVHHASAVSDINSVKIKCYSTAKNKTQTN